MPPRHALLIAVLLVAPAAGATVYRCPDADGRITYSDVPCPGGTELGIEPQPGADDEPQGLRPGEIELLERLRQHEQQTPAPPAAQPPPSDLGGCPGIWLLSVSPYSFETTELAFIVGVPYRRVVKRQCAALGLELRQYYGLLRSTVAERVRERLYAEFADGRTAGAVSFGFDQAPNRMSLREQVSGRACFGESPVPIVRVGCR